MTLTEWLIILQLVVVIAGIIMYLGVKERNRYLLAKKEEKELFIRQMIMAFAKCIDMKDEYTNGHSFRVAEYSVLLAEKMGCSEEECKDIYNIALLHDIGKISIPDRILGKPAKPTDEEYEILREHAQKGYDILKDIEIMPQLAIGAGYHHERVDGKGYPRGVKGDEIPLIAQIIAVADTFDAMYSTRPYRKQMKLSDVVAELKRVGGTQLSVDVVKKLEELVKEGKICRTKL
ncbi:HD domain-containing protein [Lachnospiraceae bacterium XBB1006]|nr:HD domain-containing protein [Lachnospiraceae bacterium XBB1006]